MIQLADLLVGKKDFKNYFLAFTRMYHSTDDDIITIKARGNCIRRAIDLLEVVKKTFEIPEDKITIKTSTEEIRDDTNPDKIFRVSTIEIQIKKF